METKCELAGTGGALQAGRRQRAAAALRHLPTQAPLLTDREKKGKTTTTTTSCYHILPRLDKRAHSGKEMEEPRESV